MERIKGGMDERGKKGGREGKRTKKEEKPMERKGGWNAKKGRQQKKRDGDRKSVV